jgi:hypothetical protein
MSQTPTFSETYDALLGICNTAQKGLELETAKQILQKIFRARLSEVDEVIQLRLEEKSWQEEEMPWPREFCLGE